MSARPKRSVNRQDYRQPADVKLPIVRKSRGRVEESSSTNDKLYRLQILKEDQENGRVKVGYVGYSDEFDEWRRVEEVVSIDDEDDNSAYETVPTTKKAQKQLDKLNKDSNMTAGLEAELTIAINARVMLRRNIDTKYGLVNRHSESHFCWCSYG